MSQTMTPPGPGMAPGQPQPQPNPAWLQWQQANQAAQAVMQGNAEKQAKFDAACELIRKDGVRGFKLDIEADSTIAPDEQAEQQARIAFMQQFVPFMQQIAPLSQGNPAMAELAGESAMFVVRGFRVARTLEESIEKAFKVLGEMPPPAPKGGHGAHQDPALEQAKIAAQVHDTQTRAQVDTTVATTKAQTDQMAISQKAQQAQMTLQAAQERAAAEMQHNQAQLAIEGEKVRSAERINQARVEKMAGRSAEGLT